MATLTQFSFVFAQILAQLPEIVVSLGICVLVLVKWRRTPASAVWALLGFGLLLALALLAPGFKLAAQRWVIENGADLKRAGLVLTLYSALGSAFRALAYGFLAAAIYTGRSASATTSPPPLPHPQFPPPL